MKKLLLTFCLVAVAVGFSACENDHDETLYDRVVGRTWVGDLGVFTPGGVPLESGITFSPDGFGEDVLYHYNINGGSYFGTYRISWDTYYDTIRINYGNNAPPREIRNVYVSRGELTGELYIFDYAPDPYYGRITLYMK